jgi:riboflavin kinase/FMN adenylyltransferase
MPFTVCRDGEPVPAALRNATVTIGNFDGVHRGHQALLARAGEEARSRRAATVVLTFEPHPREVFNPQVPFFRLTPDAEKLLLLERFGADGAVVRRFDRELASLSAAEFVDRLLVDELQTAGIVVGHDFHFGRGREGTPAVLAELARARGMTCTVVPPVGHDGRVVSSSAVRAVLEAGDVAAAADLLGHFWLVRGTVRHGDKRGRTLGYPTANIRLPDSCGLRHGIYAVRVRVAGELRAGVASFGRRPTFDNGAPLLEVYLFDFAGDLYGAVVDVEFVAWIRGEDRFESAEDLVRRMDLDAAQARQVLAAI